MFVEAFYCGRPQKDTLMIHLQRLDFDAALNIAC